MNYSASIISTSFWFLESKKVAELILEGYSKDEILNAALEDNIFQVETERRVRDITNTTYRRLKSFPEEVLEYFVRVDVNSAKIFVLISVLKSDKLFFEFMYEVFREHIVLGDLTLKNKDFEMFFDNKSYQSDIVSEWVDETLGRLKRAYNTMLSEAGVLDTSGNERVILLPFIDLKFKDILIKNDLGTYLYAITGEE
ncbi:MAG: DUF1819 family protein [Methanobrevibacter smithii]|nr:DUF1819 family protein [Methanobrevibacter smithii]MBS6828083.1 DUF1819 family protein [Methanobrevibacter smithii]